MPLYTYRREDGSTFDIKQSFSDDPLQVDPGTGQRVVRVVQAAGIIFKGSGFYVNDSKSASKTNLASPGKKDGEKSENGAAKTETTKPETKTESTSTTASSSTTTTSSASSTAE
jgi:predicted nucleic acid-binding Zn ribbon protein